MAMLNIRTSTSMPGVSKALTNKSQTNEAHRVHMLGLRKLGAAGQIAEPTRESKIKLLVLRLFSQNVDFGLTLG